MVSVSTTGEAAREDRAGERDGRGPALRTPFLPLGRRRLLSVGAAATAAAALGLPRAARADGPKFCAALGWTAGESGRHIVAGYKDAVAKLGGTIEVADANYDPKKQNEDIRAFIAAKPAALFITPSNPVAIAAAVQAAVAAGIPVFGSDSLVQSAGVTSTAMSNNYGMGCYNAQYIVDRLKQKGKVAMVTLPETLNEAWISRAMGAKSIFARYPDIKIVYEKECSAADPASMRDTISKILETCPELDAIWCAWDGPASEGSLVVAAANRSIFLTGIDGGQQAFEYIKLGSPFALTCAQSFYEMTYTNAFYAHEALAGRKVPRLVITPTYAVTQDSLAKFETIPDTYDQPGTAATFGWTRVL